MTVAQKKHIYGSLNDLKKNQNTILGILQTNIKLDEIGLIKEVHINTKSINIMKKEKAVQAGKMTVYGAIGAFVMLIIYTIVQVFITKNMK